MTTASIPPAGRETFQTVVQGQGQFIVCLLLAGVGGALPQPRVTDIAETLHMILKARDIIMIIGPLQVAPFQPSCIEQLQCYVFWRSKTLCLADLPGG